MILLAACLAVPAITVYDYLLPFGDVSAYMLIFIPHVAASLTVPWAAVMMTLSAIDAGAVRAECPALE